LTYLIIELTYINFKYIYFVKIRVARWWQESSCMMCTGCEGETVVWLVVHLCITNN